MIGITSRGQVEDRRIKWGKKKKYCTKVLWQRQQQRWLRQWNGLMSWLLSSAYVQSTEKVWDKNCVWRTQRQCMFILCTFMNERQFCLLPPPPLFRTLAEGVREGERASELWWTKTIQNDNNDVDINYVCENNLRVCILCVYTIIYCV